MFIELRSSFYFFALIMGIFTSAFAIEVNPEIGNVTYTAVDCISKNGGKQLYIERFYNSAAKQTGWFGFGHGSQFETYIKKEADGSLSVHEYGQSPARSFSPWDGKVQIDKMVDKILSSKTFSSLGNSKENLKKKLIENRNFRVETAAELGIRSSPAEGEAFRSQDYDGEKIFFKKSQYIRSTRDGRVETFSDSGKLVSVSYPQKKQDIELKYDEKGSLKNISDNFGNRIEIKFGLDGKIASIQSVSDNKTAQYSYRNKHLEKVINANNEIFTYVFDRNLNLTRVTKPNEKRPLTLQYDSKTRLPVKLTNPDGSRVEFTHTLKDESGTIKRSITQKAYNASGEHQETLKWTYVHSKSETGERVLVSRAFDDGIALTETTYRPCCYPQPTKIVMGTQQVDFMYDAENRLITKKYSSGRTLQISYDPKGLISQVTVNDVPYLFKHDLQTAELEEVEGPGYKMRMSREEGLLRNVSYSLKTDKKSHVAQYSYDKRKRLTAISLDDKPLVNYTYSQDGQQEAVYGAHVNSEKILNDVDRMMLDSMVLREVNYTF